MAQTITQQAPGVESSMATGRILDTGTVAAMAITCGFRPRKVEILNVTSRDSEVWYEGMAAASAVKSLASGVSTLIVTGGITVSEFGFTIGLDTDILVSNEQISWAAFR